MNKTVAFTFSSLLACILGLLLYAAIITINQYEFNISLAICSAICGIMAGIFIVSQLQRRHAGVYFSSGFNLWQLIFIQLNSFFGILVGFLVGLLISWLFMFPYALLFGHPEVKPWNRAVSYGFVVIAAVSVIASIVLASRWFFKSAVCHIEKRADVTNK